MIDKMISKYNSLYDLCRSFVNTKKLSLFIYFLLGLLCYLPHIFSLNVTIDTEWLIGGARGTEDKVIGRFALYYIQKLATVFDYNPYFFGVVFFVIFLLSGLGFCLFFYELCEKKKLAYGMFLIVYVTHPLWAFQFYFTEQQVGIVIAICMSLLSLWMQIEVLYKNKDATLIEKIIKMSFSCILLVLINGTYQALTAFYITAVVSAVLVIYVNQYKKEEFRLKTIWRLIISLGINYIISFIIYEVVNSFFEHSGYLSDEIGWKRKSLSEVVKSILEAFKYLWHERELYRANLLIILWIILLSYSIAVYVNTKKIINVFMYILLLMAFAIAPVMLIFITGQFTPYRTQFPIVLFIGVSILIISKYIVDMDKRWAYICNSTFFLVIMVTVYMQAKYTLRMFYTDAVLNEQDKQLAYDIVREINSLNVEKPSNKVVIIGRHDAKLNPSCINISITGQSEFSWDYDGKITSATRRGLGFIKAVTGFDYVSGDEKQLNEASVYADIMPSYPKEGYVIYADGAYYVKLNDIEEW